MKSSNLDSYEASILASPKNVFKDVPLQPKAVFLVIRGLRRTQGYYSPPMKYLNSQEWACLKYVGQVLTDDQIRMVYGQMHKKGVLKTGLFTPRVMQYVNNFVKGLI